jgi:hypothetical protein
VKFVLNGTWLEQNPFFNGKHSVMRIFNLMKIPVSNGTCLQQEKKISPLQLSYKQVSLYGITNNFNNGNVKKCQFGDRRQGYM